ncbi:MAG: hypothetical protein IJH83_01375 [Coriobacteriales bacterium]|nr:hypothetical protein [Coriobacteriales bacterium]
MAKPRDSRNAARSHRMRRLSTTSISLAITALTFALAIMAALGLASVTPPTASAAKNDATPTWNLVGTYTYTKHTTDDYDGALEYTDNSVSYTWANYVRKYGGWKAICSLQFTDPPQSIPVGQEDSFRITLVSTAGKPWHDDFKPEEDKYGGRPVEPSLIDVEVYCTVSMEWGGIDSDPKSGQTQVDYAKGGEPQTIEVTTPSGNPARVKTFGFMEWNGWTFSNSKTMYPDGTAPIESGSLGGYRYGIQGSGYRIHGTTLLASSHDTESVTMSVGIQNNLEALPGGSKPTPLGTERLLRGDLNVAGQDYDAFGLIIKVEGSEYADHYTRLYFYEYYSDGSGKTVVNIDTDAPKESGESKIGWVIPAAVIGTIVIGTGGLVLRRRNKGDKGGGPEPAPGGGQPQDDGEDPGSTFRMILWKDFGDTLTVGAKPVMLGARIEEVKRDGSVKYRPDLNERITFSLSDNLRGKAEGVQGPYQCLSVEAIKCDAPAGKFDDGVVRISFDGGAGTFNNNVHFKVQNLEILFAPIGLTFVAGEGQTFQMPFRFSDETIVKDRQPKFALRFVTPGTDEVFRNERVVRDPEFPERLFAVQLTECGKRNDNDPGTMPNYSCEVTATFPPRQMGEPPLEVKGEFAFFRYYEGLRFSVESLKCYYEKYIAKEETVVDGEELLDGIATAQAVALNMAGGMFVPSGQQIIKENLRESVRELKERFPQIYEKEDLILFDVRDKIMLTPARTHAYATLFVTEEYIGEDGKPYVRPATVLPKADDFQLTFNDVEGSSALQDRNGKEIMRPAEVLDFRYFIKDVQGTDNTVVFEILPTQGVMLPPNRAKVEVSIVATWKDRSFAANEVVEALSQPRRIDFDEKVDQYIKEDDERKKMLLSIQARIQNRSGKLAKAGGVRFGETAADMLEGAIDNPILSLNPITAPGLALYNAYTSITRQMNANIYYDNLMPIYHFIQRMIDGHEYEYGFYEPDVQRVVVTFARFEVGELGAAEAIDQAYHGYDMMFADALRMTVQDWNHSWISIGTRIGFALVTGGQSEWLFMPLAAIGAGMEASLNYIDRGGDSLLEAYRVGCDSAGKTLLLEAAIMGVFEIGAKCVKLAWILTKETFMQRELFAKALKEMFSSAKYGKQVSSAASSLGRELASADAAAIRSINAFRGGAQAGASIEREIAYTLGRLEGGYKVDALKKLITSGKNLSVYDQRAVVVAIQSDKHAMRALMEATGPEADTLRAFYSRMMGEIEEAALLKARASISMSRKIPMNKLRVKSTSGNLTGDVAAGKKVSMDMDATFQYFDDIKGEWVDLDARIGQEAFDSEFYKICKGYAAESDEVAAAFSRNADMTITDMWHPEAYSPEYEDALRVVDKSRAGEAFAHPDRVANVAEYKCTHWLTKAKLAQAEAGAQKLAGNVGEAQRLAAASEAFAEEGARQFTKQADRLIINKIAAMRSGGIPMPAGVDINTFLRKVAVLKRSGMGRFGGRGLTSAEVDTILRDGFGTTVEQLYHELNTLTLQLDNAIRAAKGV